jgi:hypothetical protein
MLRKVPLKSFSERLFGLTVPNNGVFFAVDHDEAFRIDLNASPQIEVLDDSPYPFIDSFDNALGVPGGQPLLAHGEKTVSYNFDGHEDFVEVHVRRGREESTLRFRTMSGDWFFATLSTCGAHLVLAEPYLLEVYAFQ